MQPQRRRPSLPSLLQLTILLLVNATTITHGLSDVPAGAEVHEDNGQVAINDDPTANDTFVPNLPITATIFSGVPGPFHCRGSPMLVLNLSGLALSSSGLIGEGEGEGGGEQALCYSMPHPAGCANFVANKRDGCQADLFAEPGCRGYTNTAVFVPEERAVGGLWRSVSVKCGVPAPDPETLGVPPLQDLLSGARRKPKGE